VCSVWWICSHTKDSHRRYQYGKLNEGEKVEEFSVNVCPYTRLNKQPLRHFDGKEKENIGSRGMVVATWGGTRPKEALLEGLRSSGYTILEGVRYLTVDQTANRHQGSNVSKIWLYEAEQAYKITGPDGNSNTAAAIRHLRTTKSNIRKRRRKTVHQSHLHSQQLSHLYLGLQA
jgi:hypothetical protein